MQIAALFSAFLLSFYRSSLGSSGAGRGELEEEEEEEDDTSKYTLPQTQKDAQKETQFPPFLLPTRCERRQGDEEE